MHNITQNMFNAVNIYDLIKMKSLKDKFLFCNCGWSILVINALIPLHQNVYNTQGCVGTCNNCNNCSHSKIVIIVINGLTSCSGIIV